MDFMGYSNSLEPVVYSLIYEQLAGVGGLMCIYVKLQERRKATWGTFSGWLSLAHDFVSLLCCCSAAIVTLG